MNINEIMEREVADMEREANANWAKYRMASLTSRRDRNDRHIVAAVWIAVAVVGIVATFAAGYAYGIRCEIARQAEFERRAAETDARIDAQVRAMSYAELIAATAAMERGAE